MKIELRHPVALLIILISVVVGNLLGGPEADHSLQPASLNLRLRPSLANDLSFGTAVVVQYTT